MLKKNEYVTSVKVGNIHCDMATEQDGMYAVKVADLATHGGEFVVTYQWGKVKDGNFIPDSSDWGARKLSDFHSAFQYVWTKNPRTELKRGDVLRDAVGVYYLVAEGPGFNNVIWNLATGRYSDIRPNPNGDGWFGPMDRTLTLVSTVNGVRYSSKV